MNIHIRGIFFVAFIGGSSESGSGINGIFVALTVVVEGRWRGVLGVDVKF